MTVKQTVIEKRVHRKPLHQQGPQSISGEKDPNFHYRIVNDTGSRIHAFQQAGYELVTDDDIVVGESRVSSAGELGSAKRIISNDGTTSFLMRIKKEFYDEDQKVKQDRIDELERSMKDEKSQDFYGKVKTFTK
jgi:uncharacterized iron-regulated protein